MKKLLLSLFIIFSLLCGTALPNSVYAYDESTAITAQVIKDGENYAKKMNDENSLKRMDQEVWTLTNSEVLCGRDSITGDFGRFVGTGLTKTETMSFSFGAGASYKGFTVNVGFTGKTTATYSGPTDGARLYNGKPATHRAFFTIVTGKLVRYTYKVTQQYSGAFVRTVTRTMFADKTEKICSSLVHSPATSIYFDNASQNKTKYLSDYASYIAQFSKKGAQCDDYYNF